eukprot:775196-Alexandrium_andersonii.AAC.1
MAPATPQRATGSTGSASGMRSARRSRRAKAPVASMVLREALSRFGALGLQCSQQGHDAECDRSNDCYMQDKQYA